MTKSISAAADDGTDIVAVILLLQPESSDSDPISSWSVRSGLAIRSCCRDMHARDFEGLKVDIESAIVSSMPSINFIEETRSDAEKCGMMPESFMKL